MIISKFSIIKQAASEILQPSLGTRPRLGGLPTVCRMHAELLRGDEAHRLGGTKCKVVCASFNKISLSAQRISSERKSPHRNLDQGKCRKAVL